MWECQMLYFLIYLFAKGNIQCGAEFYDSII